MIPEIQPSNSITDQAIKHGETYDHAEHGYVTVTGIWHRPQPLHAEHNTADPALIIIRYRLVGDREWPNELTEPLDEFIKGIN